MGELLSIKVSIANRTYPLRITEEEQEKVLRAAENINKRIREFEENYAVKDKQDLLAMCALQFATESSGKDAGNQNDQELMNSLEFLNMMIDEHLMDNNSNPKG